MINLEFLNFSKNKFYFFLVIFICILMTSKNTTLFLDFFNWSILCFIIFFLFYRSNLFLQTIALPLVFYTMQLITRLSITNYKINGYIL